VSFHPFPASDKDRFDELAGLFFACRDAFRDVVHETDWRPAADSAAASDLRALSERTPAYPDAAASRLANLTYYYLFAASEHLGALGALYQADEVLIPPPTLERSVLEHCARVLWVLQRGEGAIEDCLARAYLEELMSAEEAKKTSGRLLGKDSPEYRMQVEKLRMRREEAVAIFGEPITDENGRPMLRGQYLLKLGECVAWALGFMSQPLTGSVAQGTYDLFSNLSHPTLYPLLQMWKVSEVDGRPQVASRVDVENHEKQVRLAVIPFYEALSYVMSYNNWPRAPHDQLTEAIATFLPDVFVETAKISTPPRQPPST
jgi:hypothetical protein